MLWKDDYKLGNDLVDAQHMELFKRVAALNKIVVSDDADSRKKECIDAILFLKDYAINHFAAEEAFQKTLGYKDHDHHRQIHNAFVSNVLEAENALVGSDFSLPVIKEFCGFLSMWLIYHVAGADQKIVSNETITNAEYVLSVAYEECVAESMKEVLGTVVGEILDVSLTTDVPDTSVDLQIDVDFDSAHVMRFAFRKDTALKLSSIITRLDLDEADEMVYAILKQFAETICDNVATGMQLSGQTAVIGNNSRPDGKEFYINTIYGLIAVSSVKK